jgi:hypothetical protein
MIYRTRLLMMQKPKLIRTGKINNICLFAINGRGDENYGIMVENIFFVQKG